MHLRDTILNIGLILCLGLFIMGCTEDLHQNTDEENNTTISDTLVVFTVPYVNESDITYIQPFGVPLVFGDQDIRPHEAVDFGCGEGVEFKASASGVLGNIWLNYPHSYQFNIEINDRYIVHYCMEPDNIAMLSDEEKLAAIYFSPGDTVEIGQLVCKMVGGGGHLDWGLIKDDERICPACYLPDSMYIRVNELFKRLPGTFEGYENLCPDNGYHLNPRP